MKKIREPIIFVILLLINSCCSKYLQGVINTSENWAFLARFCFLSQKGRFEYNIEFNEDQGMPNLLLYYDSDDQWPAVYKTNTNCAQKESVLHMEQLQVINLTVDHPYFQIISGCNYQTSVPTTQLPKYTIKLPTRTPKKRKTTTFAPFTTDYYVESSSISTTIEDFDNFTSGTISTTDFPVENVTVHVEKRAIPPRLPFYQRRGHRTVVCRNSRSFNSARERWWFIAVSNCQGRKGIHLKYKFWMTNGNREDYWHHHFSADEFYILPVLMAFTIAYTFLLLAIVICSIELKSRQLLHTTYKIFVVSVVLQFLGVIVNSGVFLKYAFNGTGPSKIKRLGSILMGASETLYLLLLLLLAKGYTITRGRLRLGSSVKLTIFMCLYVVTYISIFIYEANVFDPGEVLYLYESPAGYGLITLRIIAWFMFIYSTIFTLKHYPEKGNFYYPFNICGTLWFIAGPAFILSANTYIDKWVRESVVCAVLQFITFGGHLTFLVLTMPSVANKNFPYHVRTSQIGIMELTGSNGVSTIEQFGHHVYQPTNNITTQSIVVPLTRRTEEIYEGMYAHDMQTTIRQQQQQQQNELQSIQHTNENLANVLNWSLAKNITALEIPNFNRHKRQDSLASSISESQSEICVSRRPSNFHGENVHFDDIIRDVPVELFTIYNKNSSSNNSPNNKH